MGETDKRIGCACGQPDRPKVLHTIERCYSMTQPTQADVEHAKLIAREQGFLTDDGFVWDEQPGAPTTQEDE